MDNSHNLLKPPADAIDVIINGAVANPMHPTIRKMDIVNVDLFWVSLATVAAALGWNAATPDAPITSIRIRRVKFGARPMQLRNSAEQRTPETTKSFLLNLSPRKPKTGCRIEPNTANIVGNMDTCVIVRWRCD